MKKNILVYVISILLLANFGCELTNKNDEKTDKPDPDPEPTIEYEAYMLSFAIVKDGKEYPFDISAGMVSGTMPYKTDMTQLVAKFSLSEGAKVYVDGVEQVSGVTVNNFSSKLYYTVVSKDGKIDIAYDVFLWEAKNTEAKLYSMSVLVDSVSYPCTIGSSTITVDFPTLNKADLYSTNLYYTISEDATLHRGFWDTPLYSGGPFNIGGYIGNITVYVKAQNTSYYTEFTMNVTCLNCSK